MTELLTPQQVADLVSLSAYTVRAAIRDGDLAATKIRGRLRIEPDAVADWIDRGRVRVTRTSDGPRVVDPAPRRAAVGSRQPGESFTSYLRRTRGHAA